ncbi:hypothetical protein M409DRAFT_54364 [Zasmidium cellare ATCC 36951]|uniref:F-box domain-containing protein n=1 Tax=Zasmidium cellare ATCC 36951 TaxID=1080233 RepID=A0A6A6CKN3_ZASCE|nr:uncharacterized protein M409DRAFT_54364 [Zasmidium cellare ATCC 36951]KAF2167173.1 hypothetical protein M409DRAFT_54364 [Zasmidium cellare ATCC 36951]
MISKKQPKIHPRSSVTTRGAKRKSVADAVFLTTELLENVLRFLPMKDLLISQRVARKWRAVISESKELQQALFMIPREADTGWEVIMEADNEEDEEGGSAISAINSVKLSQVDTEVENKSYVKHGELNPMFFEQDSELRDIWQIFEEGCTIFGLKKEYHRPRAQRTWMKRPEASWRKMLILQPPTREFWYHFACKKLSSPLRCGDEIWDKDMTVAGVMDKIEEIERLDDDVFCFGSQFMSIHNSELICPIEGDQAEIDRWTHRRRTIALWKEARLGSIAGSEIEEYDDLLDSSDDEEEEDA